jgi:hypothetical protein
MSARTVPAAIAAFAVVSLLAARSMPAQALPNITAPKTAASNAAAATNAHTNAEQNPGAQPAPAKSTAPGTAPYTPRTQQQPVKPAAPPPAPVAGKPGVQPPAAAPAKGQAPATAAKGAPAPAAKGAPAGAKGAAAPAPEQTSSVSERGGKSEIALYRETFTYQAENRRDPFLSLMRTGDLRPMVSDLRLVAVIYDPAGRSVAILRDLQTKEQYRVKVGQTLGRMRVNQIRPQQVIFTIEEIGMTRQETLGMNATNARAQ